MKVLLSWLRDFVDVPGTAAEIGQRMSLRGLALESAEPIVLDAAPPGATVDPDDAVLDFEVTANRPDCLSVLGIAREIATVYGLPLRTPGADAAGLLRTPALRPADDSTPVRGGTGAGDGAIRVRIDAPDLCGRYAAATATITPGAAPAWMQARLRALGVRPISNIVDVTNYVLLELNQPLHAFDAAKLAASHIVVRRAAPGERITTLDGKVRALDPDMLVIADAARPSAIAGVMGGADSEVTAATTHVVIESAWFKAQSVRATSKKLGLRTEASYRFERGLDQDGVAQAMARAAALLELIGAGTPAGTIVDVCPTPHVPVTLSLTRAHVNGLLGMTVPDEAIVRILRGLGFQVHALGSSWQVTAPAWRVDVVRAVDLIEEIGRHHGFEHLPATFPGVQQAPPPSDWRIARDQRVRRALLAGGCSESVTFAFIEERVCAPFAAAAHLVRLANPLSEKFAVMRPSLLPGLVDAVSHNRRRERRDVRLFEIGTRFAVSGEVRAAAFAWTGLATADHWSGQRRDVDFFDAKGLVEQLGQALGVALTCAPASRPFLVDGRAAEILVAGPGGAPMAPRTIVGVIGLLHGDVVRAHDLPDGDAVYVAELDLDALSAHAPGTHRATPLPRHPSVVRDISLLVDDSLSAESVRGTIRAAAPSTLISVREFDRYQGSGIPDGKISLSLRLTFQAPDRTLTDDETQAAMDRLAVVLGETLGAVRR